MKRIAVLGSTGSIGRQVIDVAERLPDRIQITALAAYKNAALLAEQAKKIRPQIVAIADSSLAGELAFRLQGETCRIATGKEGLIKVATWHEADVLVVSLAGSAALEPTVAGIESGKQIALASKEVLVAAGEVVRRLANRHKINILPIDSEHSAIFQCLNGEKKDNLEKIILTASGGPFRNKPAEQLNNVTLEDALAHPTWSMGKKITIDSATLMNKALEIIEAQWLFDIPADKVQVVIHPQSIVHSMVMLKDGSILAQLGLPDMRLPIQYALTYPDRIDTNLPKLDIIKKGPLTFEDPDCGKFPALKLAYKAAEVGGTMPAVFNAADEVAAQLFLEGKIPFTGIVELVDKTMLAHDPTQNPELSDIIKADRWAKQYAVSLLEGV